MVGEHFDGLGEEGREKRRRGRHHSRSRRGRRAGRDYIEWPDGEEVPKEDPREERSIALLVFVFVTVVVAVCLSIIMRSMEIETFPEM